MIEVHEWTGADEAESGTKRRFTLSLDGKPVATDEVEIYDISGADNPGSERYSVQLKSQPVIDTVIQYRWSEMPQNISVIGFTATEWIYGVTSESTAFASREEEYESVSATLYIGIPGLVAKNGWDVGDVLEEFEGGASDVDVQFTVDLHPFQLEATCLWFQQETNLPFSVAVKAAKHSLMETIKVSVENVQAKASAKTGVKTDAVNVRFDFPELVKVPCEQYLLYFAEFLKDVGIQAVADLTHDASGVLFTVTPDDKDTALDKIREALGVYLHLPNNPSLTLTPVYNQPVEVQKLAANLLHLQGQLVTASAVLQAKETTIQALQYMVNQQSTPTPTITGNVLVDSLKPVKDKDREPILGGMVVLTEYELTGININFAEIFRRGRKLFASKDTATLAGHELIPRDEPGE